MKQLYVFCLCCLTHSFVWAYSGKVDSLLRLVDQPRADTAQVNLLNEISWQYHRGDIEKSDLYASKAYQLAKEIGYAEGQSRALNLMAIVQSFKGNTQGSIDLNLQAHEIASSLEDIYLLSATTNDLGIDYDVLGESKKALSFFQASLKYSELLKDTLGICFTLNNMGLLHDKLENSTIAQEYFDRSVALALESSDPMVSIMAHENLGNFYKEKEDYKKAFDHFIEVTKIGRANDDKYTLSTALIQLGDIQNQRGEDEAAISHYQEALYYAQEMGKRNHLICLTHLLGVLVNQEQFKEGIRAGEMALELNKEIGDLDIQMDLFYDMADAYAGLNNKDKAFDYLSEYEELRDSFFTTEKDRAIAELETEYKTMQKQDAIDKLSKEADINKLRLQSQQAYIITFLVLLGSLLGFIVFLIVRNREKKTFNIYLREQVALKTQDLALKNEELKRFNYIVSHDLKEPLRSIVSFSSLVERELDQSEKKSEKAKGYLKYVVHAGRQLYQLIEDVLEFHKLDQLSTRYEEINLEQVMADVETSLDRFIKSNNGKVMLEQLPTLYTSKSAMFMILKNLVENAIKYNKKEQPCVKISYQEQAAEHHIFIEDNGIGIEEKYFDQIFILFKRLHNKSEFQGSGIGLAIVERLVDKLKGNIKIHSSKIDKGTTFLLSLPKY